MKRLIILTALYLLATAAAPRAAGTPVDVPVNVSWIPGMGLGESRGDYRILRSNLSINILAGRGGSLTGVELGGIWNHDARTITGLQAGGIGNSVGGNVHAMQLAGIFNLVNGRCRGAQLAGIGNLAASGATGIQASGIMNATGQDMHGVQVSGIMNGTNGTLNGIQIAGIFNHAADVASGMQIGLVNVSETNNGVPVGLVSYVKEEGLHGDVWTDETGFVNVGLRSGSAAIHNIVFAGYREVDGPALRTFGAGLGFHRDLGSGAFVECDLLGQHYSGSGTDADAGAISRLRLLAGYRFKSGISVYAGPVQTNRFSEDGAATAPAPWGESLEKTDIGHIRSWFGMAAGVRY